MTRFDCYYTAVDAFHSRCFNVGQNDFALRFFIFIIIIIIIIILVIILVIMIIIPIMINNIRMLNPLVNLCERGFTASQIVSAIKVPTFDN